MAHEWIRTERVIHQAELRNQMHTIAKALFVRRGTQVVLRSRYDFFNLFAKKSEIVWEPWVQQLEVIEEQ